MLFKDAPDLLSEFKNFLPDASGSGNGGPGVVGILPQPTGGPGASAPSWGQPDISSDKAVKKFSSSSKRRRRPPEKESMPVPSSRTAPSRVRIDPSLRFLVKLRPLFAVQETETSSQARRQPPILTIPAARLSRTSTFAQSRYRFTATVTSSHAPPAWPPFFPSRWDELLRSAHVLRTS